MENMNMKDKFRNARGNVENLGKLCKHSLMKGKIQRKLFLYATL